MIEIMMDLKPVHDIEAKITGLITTQTLKLYDKEDEKNNEIPTFEQWIEPPLLMIEEIDENSTGLTGEDGERIIGMKPIEAIKITRKQEKFFKKYFKEEK